MEKRAILAAVLMAAVFIVYQMFFFPETPPPPAKPQPAQTASPPPTAPATPAPAAPLASSSAPARATQTARPPQSLVKVESPLYRAVVSSEGGKLQELVLRRGEKPMVIIGDLGPAGLQLAPDENGPGEVVPMSFDKDALVMTDKAAELVLTGDANGLKIRQTLRFQPDGYAIDALVRVENPGAAPRTVTLSVPWLTRQTWRATPEKFQGQHPTEIVWFSNGSVNRIDDLGAAHSVASDGQWVALDSVWYLAALVPKGPGFKVVAATDGKVPDAKNGDKAPAGRATIAVKATPTI